VFGFVWLFVWFGGKVVTQRFSKGSFFRFKLIYYNSCFFIGKILKGGCIYYGLLGVAWCGLVWLGGIVITQRFSKGSFSVSD